jgi:hypothetical protein
MHIKFSEYDCLKLRDNGEGLRILTNAKYIGEPDNKNLKWTDLVEDRLQ